MTTILLVDEYTVMRRSLRLLLDAETDLEVCGGVKTLVEAVEGSWEPGIVIHELLLPDCTGPEVVTRLRARAPAAGLVVLSRLDTPTYIHLAFAAGANG